MYFLSLWVVRQSQACSSQSHALTVDTTTVRDLRKMLPTVSKTDCHSAGGPIASTMGQSSTPAAIPRGSTGPSETPQRSPRDSVTTEQESSASRTGDTTATELLHSSAADAAPLHRGRSTSVRKPFAYGPRKQEASENMAPNRGLSEVGGEGGSGQGWSADPRFIRG